MSERVHYYKFIIIGDGGVGKTSLRRRYFGEGFIANYSITIGADFAVRRTQIEEIDYILHFWDLAGQPRFKEVREGYYRNTDGVILVFDLSRPDTFTNLPKWLGEMAENINREISTVPLILIGNKLDLRGEPGMEIITNAQGIDYSLQLSEWLGKPIEYYETSASVDINIDVAFNSLIKQLN